MFKSLTEIINSPTNTPINKDNIVSLVMNAKAIATRGGKRVNTPKRTALSLLFGALVISKDNTKRTNTEIATINPIFKFLFISIITPFIKKLK